jgi:hypothetical protein
MTTKNLVQQNAGKEPNEYVIVRRDEPRVSEPTNEMPGNLRGKVLQDWVGSLPLKVQSVLISAQRGPDSHYCPNIKALTKWIRRTSQQNADPSHSFMADVPLPSLEDLEYELEYCTLHFTFHFLYGLEIIAYKHPQTIAREKAMFYYKGIVEEVLHFNIETEGQMDARLTDKV